MYAFHYSWTLVLFLVLLIKVLYKHGKMHLKLQHKEKSPRELVETQMVGPTPEISSSLGLGEGCEGDSLHFKLPQRY